MPQLHNIRTRIATVRSREQAEASECAYLDDLAVRGFGADDYVDSLVERAASRRSYEGERNEREFQRCLSYAGLATVFRS